ncbi:MAG: T9SS type A sorting domain-containing protein [Chitinophagaceae bacterium]|nr:MAG: T9SS type A sorting domain-containing protein [Chitinophagaceae bacterium]
MRKHLLRFSLFSVSLLNLSTLFAQYGPSQAVVTGGVWISRAQMNVSGVTGGVNGNSTAAGASQGFSNNSATTSGTISRGCLVSTRVTIQHAGSGTKQYNFRLYADWNNDGDFADAGEILADLNGAVNASPGSVDLDAFFRAPFPAVNGNIRFRWAVREGGAAATTDGGYIGEIEDYSLTVSTNNAPVLDASGSPAFNTILESQTTNPGMQVVRVIESTLPGVTMIADAGTCATQGIALFGTTTVNGSWQYKLKNGSWTAVGARSATNALLLDDSASLRFVPTGVGTSTISFRAWDRTAGTNGGSISLPAGGGSSAFSTASETASINVIAAATAEDDLTAFMVAQQNGSNNYNLLSSLVGSTVKQSNQLTTDNLLGVGRDIVLDQVNGNLFWIGGANNASIMRSTTTGSSVSEIVPADGFTNPSGLVMVANDLYILDNFGISVISATGAYVNYLPLPDPFFGTASDIEYYGGRLYFAWQPNFTGAYQITAMNTDGTNVQTIYTFPSATVVPKGLDIANSLIYFTEFDGTSTSYIRSIPITGGTATTLATGSNRLWQDLIVNVANNKIYFADMNPALGDGYLKSIPRAGGTPLKELILDNPVASLALYRDPVALPVSFVSINAWIQDSRNIVEWVIAQEDNVASYVVERSSDGRSYTEIGTVAAINQRQYQFADGAPLTGVNIYRIKAVDIDGKYLYSPIVRLVRGDNSKGVAVYPTLVTNSQFTLRLQNLTSGQYQLQVVSNSGQTVLTQRIQHNTGVTANTINLPASLGKGVYRVLVTSGEEKYTTNIVVQ